MLRPNSSSSHGAIGSFPDQSGDSLDTPRLDFEAWRALLRSNCGGEVEVTEPNAVAGWMRPLSVSGLAAAAVKIQWDSAVVDLGCNVHRVERNARYVRRDGVDHHLILYQIAGQSALTQNDQAVRLAVGDVALVDATRPVTYSTNSRSVQWLSLRLPRKSVVSHLGFELQGGLGRQGTRAGRLLFDLVRDADKDDGSASFRADSYMQLAVYDLVGALFAPSDPWPVSRHADKLFARIRGLVKDGFADPDFGPREVAAVAGISLRYLQKLFTARGTTCIASLGSRRALGASPGTGHRPASQRDRLRLWLSRLPSFRAKISQSVRLCTRYPRRTS